MIVYILQDKLGEFKPPEKDNMWAKMW